jgi:hypothetical protein
MRLVLQRFAVGLPRLRCETFGFLSQMDRFDAMPPDGLG